MALNWKVLRGSAVLSLNEVVGNACSVIRNYILAKVLSKDDFGVAATLTVTFLFLETTGKLAFGQQVMRSKSGGDPHFIDTSHTVQLAVGLLSGLVFLALAQPLAVILKMPQLVNGLRLLSLVPVCMALGHLGAFTYARELHFERSVALEAVPQIFITLIAWPVAIWLKDFRAFIWLQIGKAAMATLVSYFVSGRRYRLGFHRDFCREIFMFSWPLAVAGLIMLSSNQGDRLLMTQNYSPGELGIYAVAWSIAATPSFAILKIVGGVALPILSRTAEDDGIMRKQYALVSQIFSLSGALFAMCLVVAGEEMMTLLFGAKYQGAGVLAAWICCGQGVRMIRGAPTGVAWARGETKSQMIGNVVRLSGLLLVLPVIYFKGPLVLVAMTGLAGELIAVGSTSYLVRRWHRMPMWLCWGPTLVGALCVAAGAAVAHLLLPNRGLLLTAVILLAALAGTVLTYTKIFPEIGKELGKFRSVLEFRRQRQPAIPSPRVD